MSKDKLIKKAYTLFSTFEEPSRYIISCDCPECEDHEKTLQNVNQRKLSIEDIGLITYTPLYSMNEKSCVYFLPRLIELALSNLKDNDNDPIIIRLISFLIFGLKNNKFALLSSYHREFILDILLYIKSNHYGLVEDSCYDEELNTVIDDWKHIL